MPKTILQLTAYGNLPVALDTVLEIQTAGGASFSVTVGRLLSNPQPVRGVAGLTDTPNLTDTTLGQLIETRSNSGSATVVTIVNDATLGWSTNDSLDFQQMGTSQLQLVAGAGVTFLAPTGQKARAQGSMIRARRYGANTWVITGDVTP